MHPQFATETWTSCFDSSTALPLQGRTPCPASATSPRCPPPWRSSPGAATAVAVFGGLLLSFGSAGAQQYVVDDAEIVDANACHVEAWHGERSSWILPACQLIPNLEFAAGVGFIEEGLGHRETEYAVEAKTLLRPLTPGDWGVGLVLGVGPNPSATAEERRFGDVYGFVPVSVSTLEDRLILHGNLGWAWAREDDEGPEEDEHQLTWGVRSDLGLNERFTVIGEIFGEGSDQSEFQVGIRTHFEDAGVEMDLSWGDRLSGDERGAGFTVGLALVSPPIF